MALREGEKATQEDIIDFYEKSLASYAVPGSVEFLEELYRSPTGKKLKRALKEKYHKA